MSDSSGLTADLTSPANQPVIALLTSQPTSSSPQPPSPGSEIASAAGVAGRAGAAVAAGTVSAVRVARAGVTAAAGRAGAGTWRAFSRGCGGAAATAHYLATRPLTSGCTIDAQASSRRASMRRA